MPDPNSFDPSLNFLYGRHHQLDLIFQPKSIAVIGATEQEGSVGRTLMNNLIKGKFAGEIFPVNPKRDQVLGKKCYPNVTALPKAVDLAVLVIPAQFVPSVIGECVKAKIKAAVIISAGFKEMGEPGIKLEQELLALARAGDMRIIGPNCLGVMNPLSNLNATFAADMAHAGSMAFISQSGALCTAVLDWSLKARVGFSAFVSIGSMVDIDFGDLIDYFGHDTNTSSILLYVESLGNVRSFLSAAREVALTKPIILIKAGRTEESAHAAASHTGALAGSDDALSAALERVGVLRVDTIADLFSMAEALAKQPRPLGPHLTIVTNAGGPGVIATDALIRSGGKLTTLSKETYAALNAILPPQWSRNNPVDILGDASADKYAKAVEIAAKDPHSNGILVILTPQDMTDSTKTAEALAEVKSDKPVFASWMGAETVRKGAEILTNASIPTFEYPDQACKTFAAMWRYNEQLQEIYEVPTLSEELFDPKVCHLRHKIVAGFIEKAQKENRTILDEYESKKILEAYEIPTVPTEIAHTKEEAVALAKKMGFPVVLKIYSRTITHKSDIGGVKLNLTTEKEVSTAYEAILNSVKQHKLEQAFEGVTVQAMIRLIDGYELILGSSTDEQFGPLMLFGSGGQLVEVYQDRSLAIPPLNTVLARRMMEHTKIYKALQGVRGRPPIDLPALELLLERFSQLIVEQPWIKECDINPLLASDKKLLALDARVILHEKNRKELPRPAIRPYPLQYVESAQLKDKTPIVIRPIRPEDEPLFFQFHKDLSQETVRQRYLKVIHYEERIAEERLRRICFNDYDREIALIAQKENEILAVARLTKLPGDKKEAVFALIVKDRWQNQGIGAKLLTSLLMIAKTEKIQRIHAEMLEENVQMRALLPRFGFTLKQDPQTHHIVALWTAPK